MTKKQMIIQYLDLQVVENTALLTYEQNLETGIRSTVIWGLSSEESKAFINEYFNDDLIGYRPEDLTQQIHIYAWSIQDYRVDEMD